MMNRLVISIGNTHTRWGFMHNGILKQFKIANAETVETVNQAITDSTTNLSARFDTIKIASVVPSRTDHQINLLEGTYLSAVDQVRLNDLKKVDFTVYDGLGIDRALIVHEVFRTTKNAAIIIDFGTAMTVNVIDKTGVFVGGTIVPGHQAMLNAMHISTAALPELLPECTSHDWLGDSTQSAMQSGTAYMIASYVNSLIKTMATRFMPLNVVATGGGYKSIQSLVTSDIKVIDDLILRSLLNYDAE
ncbi:type III pantothenate kinase [Erysipelothrix aquatica]|uniref:type III pantothenate kinase n=1 Tax=Erysipelothrix aquatica TaxID=2683714 RepID=UPI001359350C|nr:type III pantothenate kinase [Erysipelothrix aquatica]